MTGWKDRAAVMAASMLHPQSRWWQPVISVPRHQLVPRWYDQQDDGDGLWEITAISPTNSGVDPGIHLVADGGGFRISPRRGSSASRGDAGPDRVYS